MAKTKQDPTGLARNRKRAGLRLGKRLTNAQRQVRQLFRNIPRERRTLAVIANADRTVVYDYQISEFELQQLANEIRLILDQELETEADIMPPDWWWKPVIEEPFRRGALEEVNEFNVLVTAAIAAGVTVAAGRLLQRVEPEQLIQSPGYRAALNAAQLSNYPVITSLSDGTSSQVIQVINQGIQAGDTPTDIGAAISKRFDVSRSNANRIAQTEVNKAFNDAKIEANSVLAEQTGLRPALIHISALLPTTRQTHAARHGKVYTPEAQLQWWNTSPNRINCFVPGTEVQGRFKAGLKSLYSGEVIKIVTRNGRNLTVTPNHKVMTSAGLVEAAKLNKGDNLLAYSGENKKPVGVSDLNVHEADSRVEDVFASLSKAGHSSVIGVMGIDFNGDERLIDKNVDAVFVDGSLPVAVNAKLSKALDYISFVHANPASIGSCALNKAFNSILAASSRFLSSCRVKLSSFFCHVFSSDSCCGTSVSLGDSVFAKYSIDDSSTDAENNCCFLDGLPEGVSFDDVVSVDVFDFSGHVYDLEEDSGLMVANGIIASNCKCTTKPILVDNSGKVLDTKLQQELKAERVFFDE